MITYSLPHKKVETRFENVEKEDLYALFMMACRVIEENTNSLFCYSRISATGYIQSITCDTIIEFNQSWNPIEKIESFYFFICFKDSANETIDIFISFDNSSVTFNISLNSNKSFSSNAYSLIDKTVNSFSKNPKSTLKYINYKPTAPIHVVTHQSEDDIDRQQQSEKESKKENKRNIIIGAAFALLGGIITLIFEHLVFK